MENIYSVRSVYPWLLFGGDFEHRRADVSLMLLQMRDCGKQTLPLAGKRKTTSGKFRALGKATEPSAAG